MTKPVEDVSQEVTRTISETSIENNNALLNLNDKPLETLSDRGILASCLMSPLSKITNPEHTIQFKLVRDPDSNRVKDLLLNKTKPVTHHDSLLKFRDRERKFNLEGDPLKMITNKNYNVDLVTSSDKRLTFKFAKEMSFDEKSLGNKSTENKSPIRLLKSPGIMAFGVSTIFSTENPIELYDTFKN